MSSLRNAVLFLAVLAAGPETTAFAQDRAASVQVAHAEMQTISDTVPLLARIVAGVESQIAARAPGIVASVAVRVGDHVEAGDELVRLDDTVYGIELDAAQAALRRAEAGVQTALARVRLTDQSLARASRLRGSTAFSSGQFEDRVQEKAEAESEVLRAKADVENAKADLARAEYNFSHTSIVAPYAGIVLARTAQPGQYMTLADTAATLLDVSSLEIEADVPADLIAGLAPGSEVAAVFDEGKPSALSTPVRVRTIVPRETTSTRTRPVRFSLGTAEIDTSYLAAGASVTLRVPVGAERRVVAVPKDALVQSRGGWIVFVAEDDKASPRQVEIGTAVSGMIEIRTGVAEGEPVVVRGNERLRPGQAIQAMPVEQAKGSSGGQG